MSEYDYYDEQTAADREHHAKKVVRNVKIAAGGLVMAVGGLVESAYNPYIGGPIAGVGALALLISFSKASGHVAVLDHYDS